MRLVLSVLLFAASLHAATATGFDGRAVTAEQLPALGDIDTVVWGSGPEPAVEGALGVLLTDGSWLPAASIAAAGAADRLLVHGPLGDLELPLEAVAGWGAPVPAAAEGGGDAVLVESGLLAGRVQSLRDGNLVFRSSLDPDPLSLPLTDVRAARLGNAVRRPTGLRLRATLDPARPGLDLVANGQALVLAAAPQVRIDPVRLGALPLRVEGGRRVYLSDIAPSEVHDEGMFGVVWPFSRDHALDGGPLRAGGILHAKGLVVHSVATLRWSLGGDYLRLRCAVGISDAVAPEGDCIGILRGDGRELWRARVRGGEPLRRIDLDLTGVRTLELSVEAGQRLDIGDHLALADAQLIRR